MYVVKEQLEVEVISQSAKYTINISYSWSAHVSEIDTPNAQRFTTGNEVKVTETKDGHLQRVLAIDNFYVTRVLTFGTVVLRT